MSFSEVVAHPMSLATRGDQIALNWALQSLEWRLLVHRTWCMGHSTVLILTLRGPPHTSAGTLWRRRCFRPLQKDTGASSITCHRVEIVTWRYYMCKVSLKQGWQWLACPHTFNQKPIIRTLHPGVLFFYHSMICERSSTSGWITNVCCHSPCT